jgi:hypothetical protein
MIQLGNQKELDEHKLGVKKQIQATYSNSEIAKAISAEDFQKNYPTKLFEIYTEESLDRFREDFMKSEDASSELLEENFKGLRKVCVTDGKIITDFYVREKPQE